MSRFSVPPQQRALQPGLYACTVESLYSKCKAHWKYGPLNRGLLACVFGSHYCGAAAAEAKATATGSAPAPPAPPSSLAFTCPPCNFDACAACFARQAPPLHAHALAPIVVGEMGGERRGCDVCGVAISPAPAPAPSPAEVPSVEFCTKSKGSGCCGPMLRLPEGGSSVGGSGAGAGAGGVAIHIAAGLRQPWSTVPGF